MGWSIAPPMSIGRASGTEQDNAPADFRCVLHYGGLLIDRIDKTAAEVILGFFGANWD